MKKTARFGDSGPCRLSEYMYSSIHAGDFNINNNPTSIINNVHSIIVNDRLHLDAMTPPLPFKHSYYFKLRITYVQSY